MQTSFQYKYKPVTSLLPTICTGLERHCRLRKSPPAVVGRPGSPPVGRGGRTPVSESQYKAAEPPCSPSSQQTTRMDTAPALCMAVFIPHSLCSVGKLYDPSSRLICGLKPAHFLTLATPHMGCDGEGPAQVNLSGLPACLAGYTYLPIRLYQVAH